MADFVLMAVFDDVNHLSEEIARIILREVTFLFQSCE